MALIEKLSAIGDAIREKGGTTELLTLDEMPVAIAALEVGGGGDDGVPETIYLQWTMDNYFSNNNLNWLLENYQDRIKTVDVASASSMFAGVKEEEINFDINFSTSRSVSTNGMFVNSKIKSFNGKFVNFQPSSMTELFNGASYLRYLPEFENFNTTSLYSGSYVGMAKLFSGCKSLRSIDSDWLKKIYNPKTTSQSTSYGYDSWFMDCFSLDEIRGLSPQRAQKTTDCFNSYTFAKCGRVKDIIFDTQDDGTPYQVEWSNQVIDLSNSVGYLGVVPFSSFMEYNHGISADECLYTDGYGATKGSYSALKDNPNFTSFLKEYSRYNHDSAVNTINSLPDASEYIASNSYSNNTIKFKTGSGEYTDGGAISTLTAEEIAVATAKGWTVSMTT